MAEKILKELKSIYNNNAKDPEDDESEFYLQEQQAAGGISPRSP